MLGIETGVAIERHLRRRIGKRTLSDVALERDSPQIKPQIQRIRVGHAEPS
jgi:hypothetical protein